MYIAVTIFTLLYLYNAITTSRFWHWKQVYKNNKINLKTCFSNLKRIVYKSWFFWPRLMHNNPTPTPTHSSMLYVRWSCIKSHLHKCIKQKPLLVVILILSNCKTKGIMVMTHLLLMFVEKRFDCRIRFCSQIFSETHPYFKISISLALTGMSSYYLS